MAEYILKSALVAEIERQISAIDNCPKITNTQISVLEGDKVILTKLSSFLDTIEMKEVDLEKEVERRKDMKTGIELIAEERQRQIDVEGYSKEHDLQHDEGEFLDAAAAYMTPNIKRPRIDVTHELNNQPSYAVTYDQPSSDGTIHKMRVLPPRTWPWGEQYWKPTPLDRIRELTKAGALIAAAIDRLQAQKGGIV